MFLYSNVSSYTHAHTHTYTHTHTCCLNVTDFSNHKYSNVKLSEFLLIYNLKRLNFSYICDIYFAVSSPPRFIVINACLMQRNIPIRGRIENQCKSKCQQTNTRYQYYPQSNCKLS